MATPRQELAAKKIVENLKSDKPLDKGEILENVGYSEGIAKSPNVVLESKGFKEILDKLLPDDKLAKKHEQLLEDEKSEIQIKALDMAYKVKSSYAPEKTDITSKGEKIGEKEQKILDEFEKDFVTKLKDESSGISTA